MNRSPIRDRAFISVPAMITGLLTATLLAGCNREPDAVLIGVSCPLTGDQAKIGSDMLHGAELAVAEANAAGGLLAKPVRVFALDDQHNATQAVAAAHRFVSSKAVLGAIAHLNSACSLPASDIYARGGLVQVTPCSTNIGLTRRGLQTLFRMCAHDGTQGSAAAVFAVRTVKAVRVFVLDDKSTYGQGLSDEFAKAAVVLGAKIIGRDSLNQGEKDFSALLTRIRTLKPQLVFFGGMYPEAALLAKQSRDLGLKATLLGGDGLYDKTLIQLAGPASAEGVCATMVGLDMSRIRAAKSFVEAYEKRFGQVGPYSPYAYDATRVVIEAIRRAGVADRAKVVAEVRNTKHFKGVTGETTFDANGDTLNQVISIYTVRNGVWVYRGESKGLPAGKP
ncbi:MAG: branched-chain amino acid ABC transporter substrate-binding protein [Candidatus Coatesbacteria bacterium]